jgi:hypothetical protein
VSDKQSWWSLCGESCAEAQGNYCHSSGPLTITLKQMQTLKLVLRNLVRASHGQMDASLASAAVTADTADSNRLQHTKKYGIRGQL